MSAPPRLLARAVDELRRGEAIGIDAEAGPLVVAAVETADPLQLGALGPPERRLLLVAGSRAGALGVANRREASSGPVVAIGWAPWLDERALAEAADPVRDLERPLKGPFPVVDLEGRAQAAEAAVALAKRAGLLPALYACQPADAAADPWRLSVPAAAVAAWRPAAGLRLVSRAHLPVEGAEQAEVASFRPADGGLEHLALVFPPPADMPLVRLHSACLTGDVLTSLKCDCGPQLRAAIRRLGAEGGILLYLQQEGRGIGLLNKLRAYALQDQGFDTVDANLRLGFDQDERDFSLAAEMLRALGVERLRLMSNNPAKAAALSALGLEIEPVAHQVAPNPHNARYLATKRDRQGHRL